MIASGLIGQDGVPALALVMVVKRRGIAMWYKLQEGKVHAVIHWLRRKQHHATHKNVVNHVLMALGMTGVSGDNALSSAVVVPDGSAEPVARRPIIAESQLKERMQ